MKKTILIFEIVLICISNYAQNQSEHGAPLIDSIEQKIKKLEFRLNENARNIDFLENNDDRANRNFLRINTQIEQSSQRLDSLTTLLITNKKILDNLKARIDDQHTELSNEIEKTRNTTEDKISLLDQTLSRNTLYWIIAVLLLLTTTLVVFFFLRKRLTSNRLALMESLGKTRKELEQEALKLDQKLIGVMETQLKIIQAERMTTQPDNEIEKDHSLALKVADEIVRIEKNLERIEDQKRIKPLIKALDRIKNNFQSNGYEIVSLLNKRYDDRMSLDVINFIIDENLSKEERIISRVIKPQVKYNDILIQRGQVDVSQSE